MCECVYLTLEIKTPLLSMLLDLLQCIDEVCSRHLRRNKPLNTYKVDRSRKAIWCFVVRTANESEPFTSVSLLRCGSGMMGNFSLVKSASEISWRSSLQQSTRKATSRS